MTTCSGCRGGRCATPDACRLAEDVAFVAFHRKACAYFIAAIVVAVVGAVVMAL